MLTAEQKKARADTIGSSDIPKIAGLSSFGGPIGVYRTKVEGFDPEDSEAAEIGSEAEPLITRLYEKRTGERLELSPTLVHPSYRWATASPDRFVAGKPRIVELKNVGPNMVDRWDVDDEEGVPEDYRAQVMWQIGITRAHGSPIEDAHVAALLAGSRFRMFRVRWDPDFFDDLLTVGWAFVSKHLRPKVSPPLDGTEESRAFLRARYPRHEGPMIENAPIETIAWAEELHEIRDRLKVLEARKSELETIFQSLIADAEGIRGTWGEATWKSNAHGNPSWKGVAETLAGLYAVLAPSKEVAEKTIESVIEEHRGDPARVFRFSYGKQPKDTKKKRGA